MLTVIIPKRIMQSVGQSNGRSCLISDTWRSASQNEIDNFESRGSPRSTEVGDWQWGRQASINMEARILSTRCQGHWCLGHRSCTQSDRRMRKLARHVYQQIMRMKNPSWSDESMSRREEGRSITGRAGLPPAKDDYVCVESEASMERTD